MDGTGGGLPPLPSPSPMAEMRSCGDGEVEERMSDGGDPPKGCSDGDDVTEDR